MVADFIAFFKKVQPSFSDSETQNAIKITINNIDKPLLEFRYMIYLV